MNNSLLWVARAGGGRMESPGSSGPLKQSAWRGRGKAPSGDWTNFISVTFNTGQSHFFTSAGASCYLLDISYWWLSHLGAYDLQSAVHFKSV